MTRSRLPPNQQLLSGSRWPVVGESHPLVDENPWTLSITGLVTEPVTVTLDQLSSLGMTTRTVDIHCVTRWSRFDATFGGILLADLLADRIDPAAKFISFVAHTERRHSSSLPLEEALQLDALVAWQYQGEPLPTDHGGPLRMVVPNKYFYKSVKWLRTIELLDSDRLGYWEAQAGYHNQADPWREQRYIAPNLSKSQAAELMASRDFSKRDLLGLSASNRDLRGLDARKALLRHADFRDSNLAGSDFSESNLSNARFQGASLQDAKFIGADLDGADFSGADLSGADLCVGSMFGTTFVAEDAAGQLLRPAKFNSQTKFDRDTFQGLTNIQLQFLTEQCGSF